MANMEKEMISWTNKLSCGVKIIDDQHKGLVNLVNEMFNHVTGNIQQERDYFNRVIQEAVNYVKIHFATEEKLMIATKFPGYPDHKKEHESFILAVVNNIKEYEAGGRITLSKFSRFLKDWILSHIAMQDKRYFEYFNKIATRKADGKLSITSDDVKNG
ncbi:MAG: bacteriohemerythrin [Treponema sp.]|nr:bacteriohemerythrin [Treponema sp.]MCL2250586.1 bacteriohemerythrin [Treponema sp.]